MNRRRGAKILTFLLIVGVAWGIVGSGLLQELSFQSLKGRQAALVAYSQASPVLAGLSYFAAYVVLTALSIPGAAVFTLIGGALFGFWKAVILVSLASSIGATVSFLVARFLFHDWVQSRWGEKLRPILQGFEREGALYLLALRLVPAFPFFVVNLLMALTPIRTWTYYWVSQLGMLPATVVYVNAGTQLGELESVQGILSPALVGSFAAIGVLPILSKAALRAWRRS